jgi:hypothetical protein
VLVLRHLTMRCWSQRRTAAHLKPIPTETAVKRVSVLDGLGRGGKRRDVTSATTYAGGTRPVQVARSRRKRSPHRRSGNGELAERHRDKGKARDEKSFPARVISRTPALSRFATMRKPSCLISCPSPFACCFPRAVGLAFHFPDKGK